MRAMWRAWFARTPYLQAPCALTAAIPDGRSTLRSGHVRTSLAIAAGAVEVKQSCDEIPRSYSDFVDAINLSLLVNCMHLYAILLPLKNCYLLSTSLRTAGRWTSYHHFQGPCSCQDPRLNEYDKWTAWGNGADQCAKQMITVDHRESFLTLEQFHTKVNHIDRMPWIFLP